MVIDFRKDPPPIRPLTIDGQVVERVNTYKYLGVLLDHKLTFMDHVQQTYSKCQQRLYLLRRLSRLQVDSKILKCFYSCHVQSLLTYAFLAWYGGLSVGGRGRLDQIVRVGSKLCGAQCTPLSSLYETRCARKAIRILNDNSHILNDLFNMLPSGRRFSVPRSRTNRYRLSFIPRAIDILNKP